MGFSHEDACSLPLGVARSGRETANFIMYDSRVCTIDVVEPSAMHKISDMNGRLFGEYNERDNNRMVPIAAFDCRGMRPTNVRSLYVVVELEDGTVVEDVDLGNGNWWRQYIGDQDYAVIARPRFEFRIVR